MIKHIGRHFNDGVTRAAGFWIVRANRRANRLIYFVFENMWRFANSEEDLVKNIFELTRGLLHLVTVVYQRWSKVPSFTTTMKVDYRSSQSRRRNAVLHDYDKSCVVPSFPFANSSQKCENETTNICKCWSQLPCDHLWLWFLFSFMVYAVKLSINKWFIYLHSYIMFCYTIVLFDRYQTREYSHPP